MAQQQGTPGTSTTVSQMTLMETPGTEDDIEFVTPAQSIDLDLEKGISRARDDREICQLEDDQVPSEQREVPEKSENSDIVEFNGDADQENPANWPFGRKCTVTFILAGMTFTTTFTSSIFSTAISATAKEYSVSAEVMTMGTSLFLLGFTLGPIIWGPISELYGRKTPLIIGIGGMACFQVGVAVAQNVHTIMLCRFFGGVLGVAPLCVVGGALADFWDPVQRGVTVGIYSMCTFVGPVAAPIMGGYVTESYLGWRWTEYISVIMGMLRPTVVTDGQLGIDHKAAALFWTIALVFLPETSHARILQIRARKIRHETKNWAVHAKADEKQITVRIVVERYFTRPFRMLWQEPILCSLALYIGIAYGILYLFLTAYPISFEQQRHWSKGKAGLAFLSITLGVILGGLLNAYWSLTSFRRTLSTTPLAPEARLPPMILGGCLLPPGLFLWAWTSFPHLTPWPQIVAGVPMGMGILLILVNGLNYIVDVYKVNANSAIAANTIVRCTFGAVFPLFAEKMYLGLGVPWATSVLGFAAGALSVGPIVFWWFGERIRRRSRFVLED